MSSSFAVALAHLEQSGGRPEEFSSAFVEFLPITGAAVSTLGDVFGSETLSASDDRAARLDELQFDLGEGPCWDALRSARPVAEASLRVAGRRRWPAFVGALEGEEVSSLFAFPLVVGALRVGAIDLYSREPTALNPDHEHQASAMAFVISRHVLRLGLEEHIREESLQQPLSRRVVYQATGIVLAQLELSPEDARLVIQGQAFATGRTMADVAEDVVAGRLRFTRQDDRIEVES
ncbi:hypothetical protein B1729_17185 [Microbacterium sp. B35-04]|uniref:GAF and ANTAR domain-containing protein n=1 Tax=Microbacterium sp. B35-04 TaxID=1961716 RepID=UPI0013D633EC|nr:GAF and ANTAR domain-containing protein [Microbacterium sp. B35-04]KAF2412051.1 hypothetical protein B1729_17185 [Microbacterium sp. B35-04]